ncbi:MAG: EAL domain-containing protein [Firmicutes bacterium]|nr:EAL domain-containing protein [Bacillota bacterium]
MHDNNARFNSADGKRLILAVDDEFINREILRGILEQDYNVIFAEDGEEALRLVKENRNILSLVLLDLIMPKMSGQEVLSRIKAEPGYQDIPVIVASADLSQEIDCLNAGASDFIQKPYPDAGVILARIRRAIELFESRRIIHSTERDPLTGLYNREFFFSYAEQFDQHHKDTPMDAIVLNINRFGILNERYGRAYADEVLKRVGEKALEMVHDSDGIVSRQEADYFLVYCPHREDYKAILDNASIGLAGESNSTSRVRLRMGVYSNVDKSLDIERRFDRAKMASDSVRNSYTRNIGVYDDTLHKSEMYAERLMEDFPAAIEEEQFKVYFQPKYDISGDEPFLAGAEGLVRWVHPELGMISPGVFIPLFEENGLIQELDHYVWKHAAMQIRRWKDEIGWSVPVSVNVSRVDMYDANMVYTLLNILEENKIEAGDLHLEVTESAYADDAEQIIETVKRLRAMGFLVEMDDFGTGYSSLNMLATLPIDVLKLDMKFIQTAFGEEKDTHMLEIIIEIARHISAPVVAEGVETEEQKNALKEIGCDMVQGYYFSPPVPPEKFSPFIIKEKGNMDSFEKTGPKKQKTKTAEPVKDRRSALKRWSDRLNISLKKASIIFMIVAFIAAASLFAADSMATRGYLKMAHASEQFIIAQQAAADLEAGSDALTEAVRSFVVTGNIEYLQDYFTESDVTKRRDGAVSALEAMMSKDSVSFEHMSSALALSNELMNDEYYAMKLVLSAGNYDEALIPDVIKAVELSQADLDKSASEKQAMALDLVYGSRYAEYKENIRKNAEQCTAEVLKTSAVERTRLDERMNTLLGLQTLLTVVLLAVVLAIVLFISSWVRKPLTRMVKHMRDKELVPPAGAEELRFVSDTYNSIFEENRRTHERLTYGNMHDALTGLYNRSAYDFMRHDLDMSKNALILVDVDKFKSVNDTYGHDVGDLVLKRVADVLKYSFRVTDLVFRLGGDEFVVIMTNVDSSIREQVRQKIDQANVMLQKPKDDLPPTSLSVGVAFADRENPDGDIFKDADTALYRVKEAGRCGCIIY